MERLITSTYDCAYEYESNTPGEKKYCLPETDTNNSLKVVRIDDNEVKYPAFSLILQQNGGFHINGFADYRNLLGQLPCLSLSIIESEKIYLTDDQMKSAKPILLIHICNFMRGHITYREGMSGVYGIEKVLTPYFNILINNTDIIFYI